MHGVKYAYSRKHVIGISKKTSLFSLKSLFVEYSICNELYSYELHMEEEDCMIQQKLFLGDEFVEVINQSLVYADLVAKEGSIWGTRYKEFNFFLDNLQEDTLISLVAIVYLGQQIVLHQELDNDMFDSQKIENYNLQKRFAAKEGDLQEVMIRKSQMLHTFLKAGRDYMITVPNNELDEKEKEFLKNLPF